MNFCGLCFDKQTAKSLVTIFLKYTSLVLGVFDVNSLLSSLVQLMYGKQKTETFVIYIRFCPL